MSITQKTAPFFLRRPVFYTWGLDLSGTLQGAGGVGGLLVTGGYYPTYDGNGNISEYLNNDSTVVAHYEYDPFGNTVVSQGTNAADFEYRFSTKPLDSETGLYYYLYRYYDPLTGRWPSRDPIEEGGGVNLSGFVENDGVNFVDILGQQLFLYDCRDCHPDIPDSQLPLDGFTLPTLPPVPGFDGCPEGKIRDKTCRKKCALAQAVCFKRATEAWIYACTGGVVGGKLGGRPGTAGLGACFVATLKWNLDLTKCQDDFKDCLRKCPCVCPD